MYTIEKIRVEKLLLDKNNSRYPTAATTIDEAIELMVHQQGERIFNLAVDIAENGLNPSQALIVMADDDDNDKYVVLEGNRRLASIWLLLTPEKAEGRLNDNQVEKLQELSEQYQTSGGIDEILCTIFDNLQEANRWVELRHTGANDGRGLVPWGAQEIRRHREKMGYEVDPAMQILDELVDHGYITERESKTVIITTFDRLIRTREIQTILGYSITRGVLEFSDTFSDDSLKVLHKFAINLTRPSPQITSRSINLVDDRLDFLKQIIDELSQEDSSFSLSLPNDTYSQNSETQSGTPENPNSDTSDEEETQDSEPENNQTQHTSEEEQEQDEEGEDQGENTEETGNDNDSHEEGDATRPTRRTRAKLIPDNINIEITDRRIKDIYVELCNISVANYPNATSVLLRVFIELSVDKFVEKFSLISPNEMDQRAGRMANKISKVNEWLQHEGLIDDDYAEVIKSMALSEGFLSTRTLHKYVHSSYVFPSTDTLKAHWDQIEIYMTLLWQELLK